MERQTSQPLWRWDDDVDDDYDDDDDNHNYDDHDYLKGKCGSAGDQVKRDGAASRDEGGRGEKG